jgi:L-2-hydroxyglutarate oxidase LhgO
LPKAIHVASQFATSLELWRSLCALGELPPESDFVRPVPHLSFVWGDDDVRFLRSRHARLRASALFADMELSEDRRQIGDWLPLVMEGRAGNEPIAATRMPRGTDVNFGALTRGMIAERPGAETARLHLHHEVRNLRRAEDEWCIEVHDSAGLEDLDLTAYLVGQAMLSVDERIGLLRRYYPAADPRDWEVQVAGLRVQIIKADASGLDELKFGTEVVASADGSIAALLGASPGASTAASIMLELLERCFTEKWRSDAWRRRLAALLPSRAAV